MEVRPRSAERLAECDRPPGLHITEPGRNNEPSARAGPALEGIVPTARPCHGRGDATTPANTDGHFALVREGPDGYNSEENRAVQGGRLGVVSLRHKERICPGDRAPGPDRCERPAPVQNPDRLGLRGTGFLRAG